MKPPSVFPDDSAGVAMLKEVPTYTPIHLNITFWSSLTLDSLRHLYNMFILADIFSFGHKKKLKMIELIMLWFNSQQQQAENLTTNLSYEDVTGYSLNICRTYHQNSRIPINLLMIIISWVWSPIRRYHILKYEDFVMEKVKEIEYPFTWQ